MTSNTTRNMNLLVWLTLTLIFFGLIASVSGYEIHEDTLFLCIENKYNDTQLIDIECNLVTADDFLNSSQIDYLDTVFKYDIDTFNSKYLNEID